MEFRVESGVKQGDPALPDQSGNRHSIKKTWSERQHLYTTQTTYSLCIWHIDHSSYQSLIDTFLQLKNNSMEVGLIINEKKTKYLKCTNNIYIYIRNESLNINNLHIEQVQQYKYLGSIVYDSNSIEEEIKGMIALGINAPCKPKVL